MTPKDLIRWIAEEHSMTYEEITSNSREADIVEARSIAVYLLREEYPTLKHRQICRFFKRTHGFSIYSYDKIKGYIQSYPTYKKRIDNLITKMITA